MPLPAADGLATSKQRGAMAATWWSRRFVDVLESYGLGTRMQRGRRYARAGQVLSFDVQPGIIVAQVQGSRRTPYVVTVAVAQPTAEQWASVDAALASRVGFVARLLAGEVPADLEDVFRDAAVELFPPSWSTLDARCSCPDWENPCKHIAAVLYLFADRLDGDPWLLLAWRGRGRDQLLDPLRARGCSRGGRRIGDRALVAIRGRRAPTRGHGCCNGQRHCRAAGPSRHRAASPRRARRRDTRRVSYRSPLGGIRHRVRCAGQRR